MEALKELINSVTFGAMLRLAAPLLLGVVGYSFSNASGIVNIALESFMTFGAFFSLLGSFLFKSYWMGAVFGIGSGILFSALYGLFHFEMKANGMITGVAFNSSAWGLTTLLMVAIFKTRGAVNVDAVSFQPISIPFLEKLPWLNAVLNNQTILVYTAPIFALLAWVVMYKTPFGLQTRMVGQNPNAAETAGISVRKNRWINMVISGAFTGLAGTCLSLNSLAMYTENMVAGRGFLVTCSVMVAKGNPAIAALLALLFGYTQSLALSWSRFDVYSQLVNSIPYAMVIVVLFVSNYKNIKNVGTIS